MTKIMTYGADGLPSCTMDLCEAIKEDDCAVDIFLRDPVEKVITNDHTGSQGSSNWDVFGNITYTDANYTALGKRSTDTHAYVRIDANVIGANATTGVLIDGDNLHKFKVTTSGGDTSDDNTVMRIGWIPLNSSGGNVFSGTRKYSDGGAHHSAVKVQILGFKRAKIV